MASFSSLWSRPATQALTDQITEASESTLREAVEIQQIPAPTFAEAQRAEFVATRFREIGLGNVEVDDGFNVYGRLTGRSRGSALAVTAHLDTVFEQRTDLTTRREANALYGPGIGDNSLGVAGLLTLATHCRSLELPRDTWFVANVGEEGLGNLNGMRSAMQRLSAELGSVIVLEGGAFGVVIHRGIGVQRRRLLVETHGGHSWSDFGSPSAIHELCRLGSALSAIQVPEEPRTTYNLGIIQGGTSINTIAAHASALLDLRSEEPAMLESLASQVDILIAEANREDVVVRSDMIGNRPAGSIPSSHPLVQAAVDALRHVGHTDPQLRAASTDANIPLAQGIPAVCIGLTVGHNAHRTDEYVEITPLAAGLRQSLLLLLSAQELLP